MATQAFAYVNLPREQYQGPAQFAQLEQKLGAFASENGYTVVRTYTDLRGDDQAFYSMFAALGQQEATAVVVLDLNHLTACSCLIGADRRAITRYLRVRVLSMGEA